MKVLIRIALAALPVMFVAGCQTAPMEDSSMKEAAAIEDAKATAMAAKSAADKAAASADSAASRAENAARAAERAAAAAERAANEAKAAGDRADRMFRKQLRK